MAQALDDTRRIRHILERLAHENHQREAAGLGDLTRGDALTLLEEPANLGDITLAAHFLDYVDRRAGILVGEGGNPDAKRPQTYRFPHRTFQEYLAACQLVEGRNLTRTFRGLAETGNFWYVTVQLGAEEAADQPPQPERAAGFDVRTLPRIHAPKPTRLAGRGLVWPDGQAGG